MEDLVEITGFYKYDPIVAGTPLMNTCFDAQAPPLSEIPLSTMGLEQVTPEIEGFAVLPANMNRAG